MLVSVPGQLQVLVLVDPTTGLVRLPYKMLQPVLGGFGSDEHANYYMKDRTIKYCGAAMTAFARLQFIDVSDSERRQIEAGLFRYCEINTLAMVMI